MPTVTQIYFLQCLLQPHVSLCLLGIPWSLRWSFQLCDGLRYSYQTLRFKDKGKAGAAVCINATESFAFSLPSNREQSLPPSAGEREAVSNLPPIRWVLTCDTAKHFQASLRNRPAGAPSWQRTYHFFHVQQVKYLPPNANELKTNWFHFWSIHRDLKLDKVLSNINQGLGSTNMFEQRSWEMILWV